MDDTLLKHILAEEPAFEPALDERVPAPEFAEHGAAVWLDAYHCLLEAQGRDFLLKMLCVRLADLLGYRMMTITRKLGTGVIAMQASSREDALWLDLQRLPERWDGTVVGDGPAARALASGAEASMETSCEAFMPWRRAAESEGIQAAAAFPFLADGEQWLMQAYSTEREVFKDGPRLQTLRQQSAELARLVDDEARLRQQRLLAAALKHASSASFITDLEGRIVWCNAAFSCLSGHATTDILGKSPKLLKSGRQGLRYYRHLWNTLRSGKSWSGETVERAFNGETYVVDQTITPFGVGDRISHYFALHQDISSRKEEQRRREMEALEDPRTGLTTPARFDAELREHFATGNPLSVALLALPALSKAADAMGGDLKDVLLKECGARIRAHLPPSCIACGSGEGEFLLLLPRLDTRQRERLLGELSDALRAPYPLVGDELGRDYRQAVVIRDDTDEDADALRHRLDRCFADQPQVRARRQLAVS